MEKSEPGFGIESSMDSTRSQYEAERVQFTNSSTQSSDLTVACEMEKTMMDSVSALLYCSRHRSIALWSFRDKGHWFPVRPVKPGQSYSEAVDELLRVILTLPAVQEQQAQLPVRFIRPLEHLRLQLPQLLYYVNRVLFYAEIDLGPNNTGQCLCCSASNQTQQHWVQIEQLTGLDTAWGSEPASYARKMIIGEQLVASLHEVTIKYVVECVGMTHAYQDLLCNCDISEQTIILLYGEYVQHCFPSATMNLHAFRNYFLRRKLDLPKFGDQEVYLSYFRAFSLDGTETLDFHDFLFGLAALDGRQPHGGTTGTLRIAYIFRFYCTEGNNSNAHNCQLSYEDVQRFTRDVMTFRSREAVTHIEQEALQREVSSVYEAFGLPLASPVPFIVFGRTIGALKIRGTSKLFHAVRSPIEAIKEKPLYIDINKFYLTQCNIGKLCPLCRDKRHIWAGHSVTVGRDGRIWEPLKMENHYRDLSQTSRAVRCMSDRAFHKADCCNELLDAIRHTEQSESSNLWKCPSSQTIQTKMVAKIVQICNEAKQLLAAEPRVLRIGSPVFVLGDIHGNLTDLLHFERVLWPKGPSALSANYLFLGDYVDRGEHSLECCLYLLCFKLLAPNHFFLLRGNHEIRTVQMQFTFHKECLQKLGPTHGQQIWEHLNEVFDRMPLAATIDDRVFCAHGGIPVSVTSVHKLEPLIPCPMMDPETESPVSWEIMWNDPISSQQYDQLMKQQQQQLSQQKPTRLAKNPNPILSSVGFAPNTKRGTGYFYSDAAVANFLSVNSFTHVIRAHELVSKGFELHADGQVVTIFSTSHYCGMNNKAAVLLLDGAKMRALVVDT